MANQTVSKTEAEVRAAIDQFVEAIEKRDIETIMSAYAPNAIVYDLHSKFQHKNLEDYRKCWQMCFDYTDDIKYEVLDIHIQAEESLAMAHFGGHMQGKSKHSGDDIDIYLRVTSCMRKIDGKWLSVHDHCSIPVDCEKDKPLWDAKP